MSEVLVSGGRVSLIYCTKCDFITLFKYFHILVRKHPLVFHPPAALPELSKIDTASGAGEHGRPDAACMPNYGQFDASESSPKTVLKVSFNAAR